MARRPDDKWVIAICHEGVSFSQCIPVQHIPQACFMLSLNFYPEILLNFIYFPTGVTPIVIVDEDEHERGSNLRPIKRGLCVTQREIGYTTHGCNSGQV